MRQAVWLIAIADVGYSIRESLACQQSLHMLGFCWGARSSIGIEGLIVIMMWLCIYESRRTSR